MSPGWPPFDRSEVLLPKKLKQVVLKATNRKRAERHSTIVELLDDFEQALLEVKSTET